MLFSTPTAQTKRNNNMLSEFRPQVSDSPEFVGISRGRKEIIRAIDQIALFNKPKWRFYLGRSHKNPR